MRRFGALVKTSMGVSLPPATILPFITRLVTFRMASLPPSAVDVPLQHFVGSGIGGFDLGMQQAIASESSTAGDAGGVRDSVVAGKSS